MILGLSGRLSQIIRHPCGRSVLVAQFVCMCFLSTLLILSRQQLPVEEYFRPLLTEKDKRDLLKMFGRVVDLLEEANITYFMDGGTLLGSYRHHGLIPWDDDLDLLVNKSQKSQVEDILHGLDSIYSVFHWRFSYLQDAWKIYKKWLWVEYTWPYVDINFFDENKTHIWDANTVYKEKYAYAKRYVFPLQKRPFEGWVLPAPCNTEAFIGVITDPEMCIKFGADHHTKMLKLRGKLIPSSKIIECKELQNIIPFVFRTLHKNGYVNESLRLSQQVLHSVLLPQKC